MLKRLKKEGTRYDAIDGWYVVSFGSVWYVGLVKGGYIQRSKQVGKIKMQGVNYFDKASALAGERNKKDGYKVESWQHIPVPAKQDRPIRSKAVSIWTHPDLAQT